MSPLWGRRTGGCHPNRPIHRVVERAGLRLLLETGYLVSGPRFAACYYHGRAVA